MKFNPRLLTIFPILPFLLFWIFAIINHNIGIIYYENLSFKTYTYVFACIFAVITPVIFIVFKNSGKQIVKKCDYRLIFFCKASIILSFLGLCLQFIDRMLNGASFAKVIAETEFVREDTGWSILTTISTPAAGFFITAFSLFTYYQISGIRLNSMYKFLLIATSIIYMCIAFLSTNRAAFLHVAVFGALYYLFIIYSGSTNSLYKRMKFRELLVFGIIMSLVCSTYFVFISSFRVNKHYLDAVVENTDTRYSVDVFDNDRINHGIVLLSSYSTQQLDYIDRYIEFSPYLAFDIRHIFSWFLRQLTKVGIEEYFVMIEDVYNKNALVGLQMTGWPSMFGFGLNIFGIIGFPIFLFILGFILGKAIISFICNRSPIALTIISLLYYLLISSYMNFNSDHFFSLTLFCIVLMWIYCNTQNKNA